MIDIIVEQKKKLLNIILKITMFLKKNAGNGYRNLSEEEKEAKRNQEKKDILK